MRRLKKDFDVSSLNFQRETYEMRTAKIDGKMCYLATSNLEEILSDHIDSLETRELTIIQPFNLNTLDVDQLIMYIDD